MCLALGISVVNFYIFPDTNSGKSRERAGIFWKFLRGQIAREKADISGGLLWFTAAVRSLFSRKAASG